MKAPDPAAPTGEPAFDDEAVQVFVAAARGAAFVPSPAETHARGRALDAKLDATTAMQRRGWAPAQVAALACSAALVAGVVVTERQHRLARADGRSGSAGAQHASAPAVSAVPVQAIAAVADDAPAGSVRQPDLRPAGVLPAGTLPKADRARGDRPAAPRLVALQLASTQPQPRGWRETQTALAEAGDLLGAVRVAIAALEHDAGATAVVSQLLRRDGALFDTVETQLAGLHSADASKLLCEQRLLRRRDRTAVDACRMFARAHPDHAGARTLAFAAARLAEEELLDLSTAEEEYSRAVLLSPIAGLPVTDALVARARVRVQLGELDEARADLRVVLEQDPAAANQPEVIALARTLGLLHDGP